MNIFHEGVALKWSLLIRRLWHACFRTQYLRLLIRIHRILLAEQLDTQGAPCDTPEPEEDPIFSMPINNKEPAPSTIQYYIADYNKLGWADRAVKISIIAGTKYPNCSWKPLLAKLYDEISEEDVPAEWVNHFRYYKHTGTLPDSQ